MAEATVVVKHQGRSWMYYCRRCLNQPGFGGLPSWPMAMLTAEAHMLTAHPIVDWGFFDADPDVRP